MQKTTDEIIDETVEYYKTHRRSESDGYCYYNGPNGEKCAFSRCCYPNVDFKEKNGVQSQLFKITDPGILLPEYAHITDLQFWRELQSLHDNDDYWIKLGPDTNELSSEGVQRVSNIKRADWLK